MALQDENTREVTEYNRLTQEEFRNRVLSPEFNAAVDAALPGGPVATSVGLVICSHGKVEVCCRECDLKARAALHDAVALAVMEERERCAKIAENIENESGFHDHMGFCERIADKIRSGE